MLCFQLLQVVIFFIISDDFETLGNIAVATGSSFCFLNDLLVILGALLFKSQRKKNLEEA